MSTSFSRPEESRALESPSPQVLEKIERLGRSAFVKRYLLELEVLGYGRSPLELEAYGKQSTV